MKPHWMFESWEPTTWEWQVALPPDAHNPAPGCVALRDWIKRKDMWAQRKLQTIPGCGADTVNMMLENFKLNLGCTKRRNCSECPEYQCKDCEVQRCEKCPKVAEGAAFLCRRWLKQGPSWKQLWGREKGKTAVLIAPGPHLEEYTDDIRELAKRDDHFLLGFSRAIFTELPLDYYFTIERRMPYGFPEKAHFVRTKLIAATSCDWAMTATFSNKWWGESFGVATERGVFIDSGMERLSVALGNVSADAFMLAYKLGAKEVLVYGYEFSCKMRKATQDDVGRDDRLKVGDAVVGDYYYNMPVHHNHLRKYGVANEKYFPVIDRGGHLCVTSYPLLSVAYYCQAQAMLLESYDIPVENRSKYGLFLHERGTRFERVLQKPPAFD